MVDDRDKFAEELLEGARLGWENARPAGDSPLDEFCKRMVEQRRFIRTATHEEALEQQRRSLAGETKKREVDEE